MSENAEGTPESEIEISEGDASSYSDQDVLDKTIDIIEQERNDIRTIIQSSLSVSGLLLTISLGALYFSYSSDSMVVPPKSTKIALFFASCCITASIFINMLALRMKPIRPIETEDRAILLKESYMSEKRYTKWSMLTLLLSIIGLFYAMIAFVWNQANDENQMSALAESVSTQIRSTIISDLHSILSHLSTIKLF